MSHGIRNNITNIITSVTEHFSENFTVDDMMVLFEDVIAHFQEQGKDLVQLQDLDHDQKIELFSEIKCLIDLIRALRESKEITIETLVKQLIGALSAKERSKKLFLSDQQLAQKIQEEKEKLFAIFRNTTHHQHANTLQQSISKGKQR